MKKLALLTLFCSFATGVIAAPNDGWNEAMTVFKAGSVDGKNGFRIPAITSAGNGILIAAADYRYKNKDWNTDMGTTNENPNPYIIIKVSNDGGNTWEEKELKLPTLPNNVTGELQPAITDPTLVHNKDTGTSFLFGYNNTNHIAVTGGKSSFFMYSSNDGGNTWSDYRDIKEEILTELEKQGISRDKYENILQGPGSGITYNGTVYVPIQMFNEGNSWGGDFTSTSGFIYSNDNGETWKVATLEGILPQGETPGETVSTSESSVFYHKGKIHLAAKVENGANYDEFSGKRVVYSYDNGKWEKVNEDFLPEDMAKCETSSLSLSEDVYLVGYSTETDGTRINTYITTNTGRKIKIFDGPTYGYTSMTADEDNLYALFETSQGKADIDMRRFDISAKEYANVNAQILNRANSILDIQDKLFASRSYLTGQYGSQDRSEVEAVVLNGNYKIGAFHKNTKKNSEDVYRTIEYKTEDTTLVLSQDNLFTNNDNIFIGYQYTKLEYINGSKNDVNSFVMGYSGRYNFKDVYNYHFALNGIYSNNKLKRNDAEGLGKSASFDSYSISMKNEINRDIDLYESAKFNVGLGLKTTYFGHDDIKEKNGNGFNDAFVDKSNNFSNEIYIKARVDKDVRLNEKFGLNFGTELKYKKELMNVDEWKDKFTVLDVEKEYSRPLSKHDGGVVEAKISASLDIADKVETSISYSIDSTGEGVTKGAITYKF
ncbi:sialidase family protein [Fusobacterium hominis]|uniref:exo-alpha-sialidase n=1 Tax=Fusobacterium hominis TaxID=2764326 RepID=A0A7G9GW96_9FUSO|nr:sialidase family protein [Fusobacterium hominis]QNM15078.1 hypothetical protein H9Q81_09210 [Fusobacterium hominis]